MKKLISFLFLSSSLWVPTAGATSGVIKKEAALRASILQTDIAPYIQDEDCNQQVQSSQDELTEAREELSIVESDLEWSQQHFPCASNCDSLLDEVRTDLAEKEALLQTAQSALESTQDLFSQTESLLEDTREQLSDTEDLTVSAEEEILDAHSVVDEATVLINYPSIPRASAIDTVLARLFGTTPSLIESPLSDPLVERISNALIPYEQSALATLNPFRKKSERTSTKGLRASILQTDIAPFIQSEDCTNQLQSFHEQLVDTDNQISEIESEIEWIQDNCASLCDSVLEETRTELSATDNLLQTTESALEDVSDMLSDAESALEETSVLLSDAESIYESVQEELVDLNSIIDQATELINDPSITNASEIDAVVATLFGGNVASIEGSSSDPFVQRIDNALIPYLESALSKLTPAKQIASGARYTLVLADNGALYACGRNNVGQLGINEEDSNRLTLTALYREDLDGLPIMITAGNSTSYVLTDNGKMYGCGNNSTGQLGIGEFGSQRLRLTAMDLSPLDGTPVMMRSFQTHVLVLTDNGKIYGCGNNGYGQLGFGESGAGRSTLTAMDLSPLNGEVPVSISAGYSHSLVLTSNGKIYGCGYNGTGELGLGISGLSYATLTPMLIGPLDSSPQRISAGDALSLVLTEDGTVYSCGYNGYGQLGIGVSSNSLSNPNYRRETLTAMVQQDELDGVPSAVVAGEYCSFVLTDNGGIYGCGYNSTNGQLGIGVKSDRSTLTAMNRAPLDSLPISLATGSDPLGQQALVLTENGKIYGCGWNFYGQLGIDERSDPYDGLVTLTAMHDIEILPDMVTAVITAQ